VNKELKTLK